MSVGDDIHDFRFAIKRKVAVTNRSVNRLVADYLIIMLYYAAYLLVRITVHTLYYRGAFRQFRDITFMADRLAGSHRAIFFTFVYTGGFLLLSLLSPHQDGLRLSLKTLSRFLKSPMYRQSSLFLVWSASSADLGLRFWLLLP